MLQRWAGRCTAALADLDVEVEDGQQMEQVLDVHRPLHLARREHGQHLEVVDTDADERQVHVALVQDVASDAHEKRGHHEAKDQDQRVLGALLAGPGTSIEALDAVLASLASVAERTLVLAQACRLWLARHRLQRHKRVARHIAT